jgi:hypothetical protein
MVAFTTEQMLPFTFKITDGRGRPVSAEGTPVSVSSDETVATVGEVTDNGDKTWSGVVSSVAPGSCRIAVTADADTDPTIANDVVGTLDVEVTLDPRTGARITQLDAGEPADKPV